MAASNGACLVEITESDEESSCPVPGVSTKNVDKNVASTSSSIPAAIEEHVCKEDTAAPLFAKLVAAIASQLKRHDEGDKRILDKLKNYYEKVELELRQTPKFHSLLDDYIAKVEETKDIPYVIIQDALQNFKSCKSRAAADETRQKRITKLEKYLERLDKAIKKLQSKEVNFDDEENSDYIMESRLKKRWVKVYDILCDLTGCSNKDPISKIDYNGTRYPEINRKITKYLNKFVDEFPDYRTILNIINETNKDSTLHLSEESVSRQAREVFEEVGAELKKRRVAEFAETFGCHLTDSITLHSDDSNDPAKLSDQLRIKLEQNQRLGSKRLDEVIEKYAAEQEERKEEPTEVADDAPSSDDEEEEDDEDNLDLNGYDDVKSDPCETDQPIDSPPVVEIRREAIFHAVSLGRSQSSIGRTKRERSNDDDDRARKRPTIIDDDVIVLSD